MKRNNINSWLWIAAVIVWVAIGASFKWKAEAPKRVAPAMSRRVVTSAKFNLGSNGLDPSKLVPAKPVDMSGEKYSRTRLQTVSTDEVNALSPDQLQYAISEMYARHGFSFRVNGRNKQFSRFPWYKPAKGRTSGAIERQFSKIERTNFRLLTHVRATRRAEQVRVAQILKREREQQEAASAAASEVVPETPPVTVEQPPMDSYSESSGETYVGPRGGVYHYSASGRKVYERRR